MAHGGHGGAEGTGRVDPFDQRQHRQLFGWYPHEEVVTDHFTFDQVGAAYNAVPCLTIGKHLIERSMDEHVKYLTVFIPNFNEEKEELYKTMLSLLKCADFMKKVRVTLSLLSLFSLI